MNPVLAGIIVVEWLITAAAGVTFLALFGNPNRHSDREMAWHLASAAVIFVLQPVGLCLAGWSLWPPVIAEGVSMGIAVWRTSLLVSARRLARRISADPVSDRNDPVAGS